MYHYGEMAVWHCRQYGVAGGKVLQAVRRVEGSTQFQTVPGKALKVVRHCRRYHGVAGCMVLQAVRSYRQYGVEEALQAVWRCRRYGFTGSERLPHCR